MTRPLEPTFTIRSGVGRRSIECHLCLKVSHHPTDVQARYCGACHLFHDVVYAARRMHAEGATHDCGEWRTFRNHCAVCGAVLRPRSPDA